MADTVVATPRKMKPTPIQMASNSTALPKCRNARTARISDAAPLINSRMRLPADTCSANAKATCAAPVIRR
ncbi:hypothetical protein BHQ23_18020 [Mycobacterium gordonae]|nr:hypothetical protein BHQ23_18020 [Mycobacterium gordonae]